MISLLAASSSEVEPTVEHRYQDHLALGGLDGDTALAENSPARAKHPGPGESPATR
jgi:hypothetical protein